MVALGCRGNRGGAVCFIAGLSMAGTAVAPDLANKVVLAKSPPKPQPGPPGPAGPKGEKMGKTDSRRRFGKRINKGDYPLLASGIIALFRTLVLG